jgi:hypothetical protein
LTQTNIKSAREFRMGTEKELTQSDAPLLTNPNLAPSAFELVLATELLPLVLLPELDLVVVGGGVTVPVVLELDVDVIITPPGFEDVVDFARVSEPSSNPTILHICRMCDNLFQRDALNWLRNYI